MVTIERRSDPAAVERILRALPSWFGIEEALRNYVHAASGLPSYLALEADQVVGVALIKAHTVACAELHLIAVDPSVRGTGVGTALVEAAEADLRAQGVKLFQVKTVGESFQDEGYAATRAPSTCPAGSCRWKSSTTSTGTDRP